VSAKVFAFVGSKGGCGATTISLAVTERLRKSGTVTLVDADFSGRRSIAVLLDEIRELDGARNKAAIGSVRIDDTLRVAELAPTIDASFTLRPDDVDELTKDVTAESEFVVVDAPQPFAAAIRPLIKMAARIFIIVEPSMLGVTGTRAMQVELLRFGVPAELISLVLNWRDARSELTRSQLERLLDTTVFAEFPNGVNDRRYARELNLFVEEILKIPTLASATELRPSTRVPLGDRRFGMRSDQGAAPRGPTPAGAAGNGSAARPERAFAGQDIARINEIKNNLHTALSARLASLPVINASSESQRLEALREQVGQLVDELLAARTDLGSAEDVAGLSHEIVAEAVGLGPLEDLMADESVTEIMVNGAEHIYVERKGLLERTRKRFVDDPQLRLIIERIISPLGRHVDESSPMVDARLPDGSRVNAIIPPLAIDGPSLTIRRFGNYRMTFSDLLRVGAATQAMMSFLKACVEARQNIIISGGTGSGKTTFLNILSAYIPMSERIVTIEDAAELRLIQDDVVRLEARPPNVQGAGEVRIRDLVRNSLRMRPDRIIVGEVRGGEALDMLQAMNTGHDGSLTTVHANTPRDALSRIETLVLMAGLELPLRAIAQQISNAINIIIQTSRMRDGSRKVVAISELVGMEGDVITMQDIIKFDEQGVTPEGKVRGEFVFTGVQPICLKRFEELGVIYDIRELSAAGAGVMAAW
jgi:Flp pilus assembly CpaF family ATPase/MinD superfamily P-loop ATPase